MADIVPSIQHEWKKESTQMAYDATQPLFQGKYLVQNPSLLESIPVDIPNDSTLELYRSPKLHKHDRL